MAMTRAAIAEATPRVAAVHNDMAAMVEATNAATRVVPITMASTSVVVLFFDIQLTTFERAVAAFSTHGIRIRPSLMPSASTWPFASAIFWLKFFWTVAQPATCPPASVVALLTAFTLSANTAAFEPVSSNAACIPFVPPTMFASAPT